MSHFFPIKLQTWHNEQNWLKPFWLISKSWRFSDHLCILICKNQLTLHYVVLVLHRVEAEGQPESWRWYLKIDRQLEYTNKYPLALSSPATFNTRCQGVINKPDRDSRSCSSSYLCSFVHFDSIPRSYLMIIIFFHGHQRRFSSFLFKTTFNMKLKWRNIQFFFAHHGRSLFETWGTNLGPII